MAYNFKIDKDLDNWNINLEGLIERNVRLDDKTHFWKDIWCEGISLKDYFLTLYRIEAQKKLYDRGENSTM